MTEASFHRTSGHLASPAPDVRGRPLPLGYGLLIGAAASLGLWFVLGWAIFRMLG